MGSFLEEAQISPVFMCSFYSWKSPSAELKPQPAQLKSSVLVVNIKITPSWAYFYFFIFSCLSWLLSFLWLCSNCFRIYSCLSLCEMKTADIQAKTQPWHFLQLPTQAGRFLCHFCRLTDMLYILRNRVQFEGFICWTGSQTVWSAASLYYSI